LRLINTGFPQWSKATAVLKYVSNSLFVKRKNSCRECPKNGFGGLLLNRNASLIGKPVEKGALKKRGCFDHRLLNALKCINVHRNSSIVEGQGVE
jgi:hypothetical protein